MRSRLRAHGLLGNPFVVFTDITISLACIFMIYGLSTSESLAGVTRLERQIKLRDELDAAFHKIYPDAPPMRIDPRNDKNAHEVYEVWTLKRAGEKHSVVEMQVNAGLFRISLLEAPFASGDGTLDRTSPQAQMFLELARKVADEHREYTYLFLQGIAERKEVKNDKERGMQLSIDRARAAYTFLQDNGVIGRYPEPPKSTDVNYVFPSRVLTFGTGFWLYQTDEEPRGRVDMFMFFNDQGDQHK